GLTVERASQLIRNARKLLEEKGILEKDFVRASEVMIRRSSTKRLTTGSKNLDALLKGGFEAGAVTELYGEFGSGKTQICHTASVLAQLLEDQGGLGGHVIYVDTENTFRPERIAEIAENRGLDPGKILEGILVARAYSSSHLSLILREIGKHIEEERAKVLIIDSMISHFRAEYPGRATLAERQQKLNAMLHQILRTAEVYGVVVLATNQVSASPEQLFSEQVRAAGGNILAHGTTYRLFLKKAGRYRIARIVDSPYHPEAEAVFAITPKGIEDPPEKRT
ncbi:MAG: DNA repair and recombination protein RadA, partial [Nitrososphaeria archaeon]